jgi:hypothetical protein
MDYKTDESIILEETGINIQNEKSLHANIKNWYSRQGDRLEVKLDGFIIDIVRDNLLIEIQTRNFSAIGRKLRSLVKNHKVKLVYPVPVEKWITTIDELGTKIISRRKSPKRGSPVEVFNELVRIPDLINEENFMIEILLVNEEEIRCKDGKGSWRRNGTSIRDTILLEVTGEVLLYSKKDFLKFLPEDLEQPFTNKSLSQKTGIPISKVRKMTYCMRKMGIVIEIGKNRNELLFSIVI